MICRENEDRNVYDATNALTTKWSSLLLVYAQNVNNLLEIEASTDGRVLSDA